MSKLCQNLSVSKKKPLTCINQEICGQKTNSYAILWKILTFMKLCGDYLDIDENERIFASNANECIFKWFAVFERVVSLQSNL